MSDLFNQLPEDVQEKINNELQRLQGIVGRESIDVFKQLIEKCGEEEIYNLGLYYPAGSWGYLIPTISTKRGLNWSVTHHIRHSPLSLEEASTMLRWSPCDSPYHSDGEIDVMMPDTEDALQDWEELISSLEEYVGGEPYYQLINEIHQMIHDVVIDALKKSTLVPEVKSYREAHEDCMITLSAGDLSDEEFLADVKAINGDAAFEKVSEELSQAHEMYFLEDEKWQEKLEQEKENPPTTSLVIEDFAKIVEKFEPQFKEDDGAIYVVKDEEYWGGNDSSSEGQFNRFELMRILSNSPHYDELDKLFGHFLGVNFQKNDLLPQICRALVKKLEQLLVKQFPSKEFCIYLCVDRSSLYYFTFFQNRHDSRSEITPWSYGSEDGVHEMIYVGKE